MKDGHRFRVLLVIGTRPEAIKMAPLALELRSHAEEFETTLLSTGQHRGMLDQALAAFGLEPDGDLRVMTHRQSLTGLTTRALSALDDALRRAEPEMVVVQGDTTSAMVGALAAYYRRVPVAHLEAGLRTGDLYHPFPEEGNRRLIGALAALHFAPTSRAAGHLAREGVPKEAVYVTGNTGIDALLRVREDVPRPAPSAGRRVLLTMHRRESYGAPLKSVCLTVRQLAEWNPEVEVVFPVHASPAVRETVERLLGGHARIRLCGPMDYAEFIGWLDSSYLVLTDSGGVQEEAPALGKPVLVLRDRTERPESIEAGTALLVGTDPRAILRVADRLLHDETAYRRMARAENPFGDGHAAERVVGALRFYFGLSSLRPAPFAPSSEAGGAKRIVA